jgi:hypothetical protein
MKKLIYLFCITLFVGCSSSDENSNSNDPNDDDPMNTSIEIITLEASDIGATKVITGGKIIDDGGNEITVRGIVWGISENPTLEDSLTFDGLGDGVFESSLFCLDPSTTYYVRAYATNSEGTGYGNQIIFNTLEHITFEGDVSLLNQYDVDSFGANGYTKIDGDIIIGDPNAVTYSGGGILYPISNITNLDALSGLTQVTGAINIRGTNDLNNLEGLSCLKSSGSLGFYFNISLSNLDGLNNLTTLDTYLGIDYNNALNDVNGLSNLTGGSMGIQFSRNETLSNLDGLSGITSLSGIDLDRNPNLSNIDGLNNLNTITSGSSQNYSIQLSASSTIEANTYANGFNNLTSVNGRILLGTTSSWQTPVNSININGFNSLTSIGGNLTISQYYLNNTTGFSNLTTIDGIFYVTGTSSNTTNPTLNGFNSLENVQSIRIDNTKLLSISGFNSLTTLNSSLDILISNNNLLTEITAFSNLTTVNAFSIFNAPSLSSFALNNLTTADYITVLNTSLTTINLNNLTLVNTDITLYNNSTLTNFCSLQNLFNNGSLNGTYQVSENGFNPTQQDIIDGNCSL